MTSMTTEEVRDNVRKILREQYFSEEEAMVDEIIIAMAKEKTDLWWKRLKASVFLIGMLSVTAATLGQTVAAVPQLSETERLALKAVTEEIAQVNKDYAALQAEVMKNHPGFTLNAQSGQLEPIKAAAPEPKKEKK